jgi:hypothetical protein
MTDGTKKVTVEEIEEQLLKDGWRNNTSITMSKVLAFKTEVTEGDIRRVLDAHVIFVNAGTLNFAKEATQGRVIEIILPVGDKQKLMESIGKKRSDAVRAVSPIRKNPPAAKPARNPKDVS